MLNTLKFQRNPAIAKAPEVAFRGQFLELMGGVEPPTFSLRMRCSAIKLHQRIALCKYSRARLIIQSVFYSLSSSFGASSETVCTSFVTRSATLRKAIATVSPVDAPAAFFIILLVSIFIFTLLPPAVRANRGFRHNGRAVHASGNHTLYRI